MSGNRTETFTDKAVIADQNRPGRVVTRHSHAVEIVPQGMRADAPVPERRAGSRCACDVLPDDPRNGVAVEASVPVAQEQRLAVIAPAFLQPCPEHGDGILPERGRPLPAALAADADMGSGSQLEVAAVEAGQLGHPEAGLDHQQEQRPVSPPLPGGDVRCGEEGAGLHLVEVFDHALFETLGGQCEHLLAMAEKCRLAAGHMAEERPDRRKPSIAGAGAVAPPTFEVVEEAHDEPCIDVLDPQVGRAPPGLA